MGLSGYLFVFAHDAFNCTHPLAGRQFGIDQFHFDAAEPVIERVINSEANAGLSYWLSAGVPFCMCSCILCWCLAMMSATLAFWSEESSW